MKHTKQEIIEYLGVTSEQFDSANFRPSQIKGLSSWMESENMVHIREAHYNTIRMIRGCGDDFYDRLALIGIRRPRVKGTNNFNESIYFNRKLKHDLVDDANGHVLIPAFRKLTKKLVNQAAKWGYEITEDMLHDDKKERAQKQEAKRLERITYLKARIAKDQAELSELEG